MQAEQSNFVHVGVDLRSTASLQPLVAAFDGAFALHSDADGRENFARLELHDGLADVESTVLRLVELLEALPPDARTLWNNATQRDFNIGVQVECGPHTFEVALPPGLLKRVAQLGARVVTTVYAPPSC